MEALFWEDLKDITNSMMIMIIVIIMEMLNN